MNWDLTDVPAIAPTDLAAAVQALIADGRGLALLRGLEDADLNTVQAELKRRFHEVAKQLFKDAGHTLDWIHQYEAR